MPRFYALLGHVAGWAAGVFAILALLAAPSVSRADNPNNQSDCNATCLHYHTSGSSGYIQCMQTCMYGGVCPNKYSGTPPVPDGCVNPGAYCVAFGRPGTCTVVGAAACDCTVVFAPP